MGFFDAFPRFYSTSGTGATPGRLDARHQAIIKANLDAISGKRILDLASHDGRWSFAALQAGCSSVVGVEARTHLVANAIDTFGHYGIEGSRYEFVRADVFDYLPERRPEVDTVFVLGFFYHIHRHGDLARLIAATDAEHIILDTNITPADGSPLIRLMIEPTDREALAIGAAKTALVGVPSREAIRIIFEHVGYSVREFDWAPLLAQHPEQSSDDLFDYRAGVRSTFVLSRYR